MKILVIGGSQFYGRYCVETALERGHAVTLFNRGKTRPDLFPQAEHLVGDRNGDLAALDGRSWDAVVDTCGYGSASVARLAGALADRVEHYTFVSSQSVYEQFAEPDADESAPLREHPADAPEDEKNAETYGARKVLCERAAEAAMPGRVLSVRAGMIVGPHDYTDRFTYWVRRGAVPGPMLAPGPRDQPIQLVDVRDLADWTVRMAEERRVGPYNATGPREPLTMESMLLACCDVPGGGATPVWADAEFLLANDVAPWSAMPFWIPGEEYENFFRVDCSKAIDAGLRFRPLSETVRDTLAWDAGRDRSESHADRPLVASMGKVGLDPEREAELLAAWRAQLGV